jgi:hypothetical protein
VPGRRVQHGPDGWDLLGRTTYTRYASPDVPGGLVRETESLWRRDAGGGPGVTVTRTTGEAVDYWLHRDGGGGAAVGTTRPASRPQSGHGSDGH